MHKKHSSSIQLKCDMFLCSVAVLVTCIQQQEHVQVGVVSIQPLPKLRWKLMLLAVTHDASGTSYTAAVLMACFQHTSLWDTLVARMWQYA